MLIDWFTVCAQLVNFLVLVWLLKRFLYHPVLQAIAAQEKWIAGQLKDAADKKAQAQKDRDDLQQRKKEFELRQANLLAKALVTAETERQRLLVEARKDSETLRQKWQDAAREEYAQLNHQLANRAQQEVLAISRKVLADLSTVTLEEAATAMLLRRLQELKSPVRETLLQSLKDISEPVYFRSTFLIPPPQQISIRHALNQFADREITIQFETVESLLCGLELIINGQKFAWNMDEYIHSFEKNLGGLVNLPVELTVSTPSEAK